jgi:two-component system, OmpR family, response regulator
MMLPRSQMRPTGAETEHPDVPPKATVSAPPLSNTGRNPVEEQGHARPKNPDDTMRILIIEDDKDSALWLSKGLKESGHLPDIAHDGETGLALAREGLHDILIVDRMLPKLDGLSIVRTLRGEGNTTPVLILSALSDVDERVRGLRAGGDDYLAKPYAFAELLARLEGMSRRNQPSPLETRLKVCDLEIDLLTRQVSRDGKPIVLQPREFKLLEYMMRHAGHIVTRTMLLENVWDYHFDPQTNVIDVHVSRLRGKIDKGFAEPILQTIRGAGYMLRDR